MAFSLLYSDIRIIGFMHIITTQNENKSVVLSQHFLKFHFSWPISLHLASTASSIAVKARKKGLASGASARGWPRSPPSITRKSTGSFD
jgi:hypothetical protein